MASMQTKSAPGYANQPAPPRRSGSNRTAVVVAVVAAVVAVAAVAAALLMMKAGSDDASATSAPTTSAAPTTQAPTPTTTPATTAPPVTTAPSTEVAAEPTSSGDIVIDDVYVDADGQVVVEGSTVTGTAEDIAVTVVNNSGVVTTVPVKVTDVGGGKFHMNVDWAELDVTQVFGSGSGPLVGRNGGSGALAGSQLQLGSDANPGGAPATISFSPSGGGRPGGSGSGIGNGGGLGGRN